MIKFKSMKYKINETEDCVVKNKKEKIIKNEK